MGAKAQRKAAITYSQMRFMDKCARGHGPGGNTNATGTALEKRGLAKFKYSVGVYGQWELTEAGKAWRDANLNGRERLIS